MSGRTGKGQAFALGTTKGGRIVQHPENTAPFCERTCYYRLPQTFALARGHEARFEHDGIAVF
jgi:hypothetical protein